MAIISTAWRVLLNISCIIIILQKISAADDSKFLPSKQNHAKSRTNLTDEIRLQRRVLMEYEKRKAELEKRAMKSAMYTNLFVLKTNDTDWVRDFARKHGFILIRKVFKDEDFYLYRHVKCGKRCRRSATNILDKITKHPKVEWVSQQPMLNRVQRYMSEHHIAWNIYSKTSTLSFRALLKDVKKPSKRFPKGEFNDPLFEKQWYLHNTGQTGSPAGNDINVFPVWKSGITGRGVRISVLDDGIYSDSAEVADNYDSISSEDLLLLRKKFSPVPENSHGTYCAAIAAGVANNKVCGIGVAYEAKVGGVRILDGPVTDVQEAVALVHALEHVDIYTASWGPSDDGKAVDGPHTLTRMAFVIGVTEGRKGKGAIYVWAAGNGGAYQDNCNLDGYAASPYTFTIGALTEDGRSTFYTEPCPTVIASTYVGGRSHSVPSYSAYQEEKRKIKVVVPEGRGKCKENFQGTSAAAPMAAGVIALALQANPRLTWRDVQHIIINTSRIPAQTEVGWMHNAAGHHFHPKIGSGVLDADAMVNVARVWKLVKPLHIWTSSVDEEIRPILPQEITYIKKPVHKWEMNPISRVDHLESIITTINLIHLHCGDLEMFLKSPSGTVSQILTKRKYDNQTKGFHYLDFNSLHFWGEDPEGVWTLEIIDSGTSGGGIIDYFALTLHGTSNS